MIARVHRGEWRLGLVSVLLAASAAECMPAFLGLPGQAGPADCYCYAFLPEELAAETAALSAGTPAWLRYHAAVSGAWPRPCRAGHALWRPTHARHALCLCLTLATARAIHTALAAAAAMYGLSALCSCACELMWGLALVSGPKRPLCAATVFVCIITWRLSLSIGVLSASLRRLRVGGRTLSLRPPSH